VILLTSGTLLNNWAFAYRVPLTLQIVFRSSGLPVSMILGRLVLRKQYTLSQICSVGLVTVGVILATVSRSSSGADRDENEQQLYLIGITMLCLSMFLVGFLGILQEQTYSEYGPCWKEGVFYTHLLSLPVFAFLEKDIRFGFGLLATSSSHIQGVNAAFFVMSVNLLTQLLCVSGVNQLTSKVSSVSTNVVLTSRKALSLCLSVWLFRGDWNVGLVCGAVLVFSGSLLYTFVTAYQ